MHDLAEGKKHQEQIREEYMKDQHKGVTRIGHEIRYLGMKSYHTV